MNTAYCSEHEISLHHFSYLAVLRTCGAALEHFVGINMFRAPPAGCDVRLVEPLFLDSAPFIAVIEFFPAKLTVLWGSFGQSKCLFGSISPLSKTCFRFFFFFTFDLFSLLYYVKRLSSGNPSGVLR